ncbi:MAG: putative Universal stress protein [Verrucomicrobiales bacterium]|nr:putative Universal stress protein [Verrucomicrobiales bacterium]
MHLEDVKNECRTVQEPADRFVGCQRDLGQGGVQHLDSVPASERGLISSRSAMPATIKHILVPIDFSSCSMQALKKAVPLARQCGATITLLYVMDLSFHTPPTGPANADKLKMELEAEGRVRLGETIQELKGQGVELRTMIQEGLPYERICEAARQSDVIVIGNTKPKPFWHLFSRRTAEAVLEKAPCPVLIVQDHEPGIMGRRRT